MNVTWVDAASTITAAQTITLIAFLALALPVIAELIDRRPARRS